MKKTAVIFPGIGYHADKPLLYHSGKLAASYGYDVIRITYPKCEVNLKGASAEEINAFAQKCLKRTGKLLKDADLSNCEDVLFISKSIGTVIASAYGEKSGLDIRHVFFTPLVETFDHDAGGRAIAFNGTSDNWADCGKIAELCFERKIPLTTSRSANHSLETGDVLKDIKILENTMAAVSDFILKG